MNLKHYEPISVFNALSQELDRWMDNNPGQATRAWTPAADIEETDGHYFVRLDVPGVDPQKIEVRVEKSVLTVEGEREAPASEAGRFTRVERIQGKFVRQFRLPDVANDEAIEADYAQGVLTVRIAKKQSSQPRQIEVRVS
ncbi:Hsp20/alpha crystallin family protein [uncultured Abyssibacter sp.]|uniref:Hsp20/alpha crystallin family protein n=1 Tax=uncultured Abyssibacter sp. TaxID=2320202 RepID=UPI0032B1E04E